MSRPKGGLGKGLGSLIPPKIAPTEGTQEARVAAAPEVTIKTELIVENPHQPRVHFRPDDLEDLVASIKEHGILQPLLVIKRDDGKYELIAGERRLRSARLLNLEEVPVVVRPNVTEQQKLELALIENIQRSDLNAVEEAQAYQSLTDLFSLKQAEVAKRVGKSRSYVANLIRLLELDEDIQQAMVEGKISRSHARTLLAESDPEKRRALFERMLEGGMTVREAEEKTSKRSRTPEKKDANVQAIEEQLRDALGTKVKLKMRGGSGKIEVHFYSKADLKNIVHKLVD